ncbi:unnamed protein product (macronuclear) [Paramecium tetraurelia]|uniref:Uncharacterized protein n=1 Tax=Paramecium tetraurelia TaxID=5888 RepID=A0D725_PARTE|nr:uncharacterized protein GSPATT00001883001 [Paramecium tetraurelia]CAK78842.1 unnamed protein product [Paramecium tetraurelia]|eukprot:XP_001446239.1 hypothetical protein (macronuclear) [Paramecium tetraurelia strain d4-2]
MQMKNNSESQLESLQGDISLYRANATDTNSMQAEFFAISTQLEGQIAGLRRQLADLELLMLSLRVIMKDQNNPIKIKMQNSNNQDYNYHNYRPVLRIQFN